MSARGALRIAILAVAFALGTVAFGWLVVPVLGAAWGVLMRSRPRGRAATVAALGALVAWAALLAWSAARGPIGELATKLGSLMQIPAAALLALTLVFPALLAWSATFVASTVASAGRPRDEVR